MPEFCRILTTFAKTAFRHAVDVSVQNLKHEEQKQQREYNMRRVLGRNSPERKIAYKNPVQT